MVYKKKYAARRIQRAWRRRRRYGKPRRPISRATGLLKCVQSFSRSIGIPNQIGPAPFTFVADQEVYSLNQVPTANLTAFTRLFKYWKIDRVVHTFIPKYIGEGVSSDPQPQLLISGNFMSSITLDSNQLEPTTTKWANVDEAEQSGNLKKKYLSVQTGKRATAMVSLVPRTNNWIRTSASNNNQTVALGAKQWISTGTPGTELFGLRWAYEIYNNHPALEIEVRTKMYFSFKGVN